MGAGKSAVARRLAERLHASMTDLDERVEREEGRPIVETFERQGEDYFRAREAAALDQALREGFEILACGGGIVLDSQCRSVLRDRCLTVWLEVTPENAARRLASEAEKRPLLRQAADPAARLARLLEERASLYREVAAFSVVTDGRSPSEVGDAVLERVAAEREP